MDGWRNQGVNFNQEVTRTRSNGYRKPPLGGNSNWQQSVPSWEKKFCTSIGSVPWKKLVETKKFIHLYENVIKWNDSAGKEAFQNAKNRFYANIHGLPCDTIIPDPDIYIDKIDWNSQVDPNLILDLESDPVPPPDPTSKNEQVVIFGSSFPPSYQSFSPYGWGDSDDDKKKDSGNEGGVVDNNNSWWGWNGKDEKDKGGWNNMYDNNNYFYGDANNERREREGNMSRYKTSRFRGEDSQRSNSRRNNGNRRKSTYSCATPGNGGDRWNVKKPVS